MDTRKMLTPYTTTSTNTPPNHVRLGLSILFLPRRRLSCFHLQPLHYSPTPPLLPHHRLRPTSKSSRSSIPRPARPTYLLSAALRLLDPQIQPAQQPQSGRTSEKQSRPPDIRQHPFAPVCRRHRHHRLGGCGLLVHGADIGGSGRAGQER